MSNVPNTDMVNIARNGLEPHAHEMHPFTDHCTLCGRSRLQIVDRNIHYCDAVLNKKRKVLDWGDR